MSGLYAVWAALTAISLLIKVTNGDTDGMRKTEFITWNVFSGIQVVLFIIAAVLL